MGHGGVSAAGASSSSSKLIHSAGHRNVTWPPGGAGGTGTAWQEQGGTGPPYRRASRGCCASPWGPAPSSSPAWSPSPRPGGRGRSRTAAPCCRSSTSWRCSTRLCAQPALTGWLRGTASPPPPGHSSSLPVPPPHARTVGLAALHALDAEQQVLVPQVLQVGQDGVQLHGERAGLGGAAGQGARLGSVLGDGDSPLCSSGFIPGHGEVRGMGTRRQEDARGPCRVRGVPRAAAWPTSPS